MEAQSPSTGSQWSLHSAPCITIHAKLDQQDHTRAWTMHLCQGVQLGTLPSPSPTAKRAFKLFVEPQP
eukprot:1158026-Pelagomonas_calceolata.AAC.2